MFGPCLLFTNKNEVRYLLYLLFSDGRATATVASISNDQRKDENDELVVQCTVDRLPSDGQVTLHLCSNRRCCGLSHK